MSHLPGSDPPTPQHELFDVLIGYLMDWPPGTPDRSLGPNVPALDATARARRAEPREVRWVIDGLGSDQDWLAYWEYRLESWLQAATEHPALLAHSDCAKDLRSQLDQLRARVAQTRADLRDPTERDHHLHAIDTIMHCELDIPRSTIELHAISRGHPDRRRLVTHPRADLLCPCSGAGHAAPSSAA